MKIAIYGKDFNDRFTPSMELFLNILADCGSEIWMEEQFLTFTRKKIHPFIHDISSFSLGNPEFEGLDYLFSIGGDGTFLEAATLVRGTDVPLIGINSGRLGFLANISKENVSKSMEAIIKKEYELEERALIEWETADHKHHNFALNEVSVQKKGVKMLGVHAFINGELLNS